SAIARRCSANIRMRSWASLVTMQRRLRRCAPQTWCKQLLPTRLVILAAVLTSGAVCAARQHDSGTTLDRLIARYMAGKSGGVVVLDVSSGKILGQSNVKMAAERVTTPGSVVKPFVLLELLQSSKLDPEQHLVCRRALTIGGRRMDCTHSPAVTNLDAADAIAYSCNTYFAKVATKLSPSGLA